uniref:CSON015470 protein n=1 Tax=Culicoides sonorensis TaxID=179676 RepID=A0A336MD16_CULSO
MKQNLKIFVCLSMLILINGDPSEQNKFTKSRKISKKSSSDAWIASNSGLEPTLKPKKIKENENLLVKKLIKDDFGYENDRSVENFDDDHEKDSGIEYIPVALHHPLFKVFGINPDDYVVYYKRNPKNTDNSMKFDANVKFNEIDLLQKASHVKNSHSNNVSKRNHRHITAQNHFEGYDFDLDETPYELVPVPRKRSCGGNSLPFYPMPMIYPQFYPPYQFPSYPSPCSSPFGMSPCTNSVNPPTWPLPDYSKSYQYPFALHPGTYDALKDSKGASVVQVEDKPRDYVARRRRSIFTTQNNRKNL